MNHRRFVPFFLSATAILAILFAFVKPGPVSAGTSDGPAAQDESEQLGYDPETGQLIFVGPQPGGSIPSALGAGAGAYPVEDQAMAFVGAYGPAFGLQDPAGELALVGATAGPGGPTVIRYQQVYQGVPVLGAQLIVKLGADGSLLSMLGQVDSGLTIGVRAAVPPGAAIETAKRLVVKTYSLNDDGAAKLAIAGDPALWIYDEKLFTDSVFGPQLTWMVEVTAPGIDEIVLVNAAYGKVSMHYSQIDHSWTLSQAPSGERARDPIVGVGGSPDWSVYSLQNYYEPPYTGVPRCNDSAPDCGGDLDAYDARDYGLATYNFYWNHHGRDSIDGAGMEIVSNVHYGDPYYSYYWYSNAYWDSDLHQMVYGDWMAVDDVVGHELTHGVTDYTSGLLYLFQPGAINESMSDVFGEFVDLNTGGDYDPGGDAANRWLIGEDILGASYAFRDMKNPPHFGDPDKMTSANYFKGPGDYGGVHANSGVNNKAAYLMTDGGTFNGYTITGIGIDKVAAIYYKVQTEYLFAGSDYLDLYYAINGACSELIGTTPFGSSSPISIADCQQVAKATLAVQMNQKPPALSGPDVPVCPTGYTYGQQYFRDDFESGLGLWNFTAEGRDPFGAYQSLSPSWTSMADLMANGGTSLYAPGPEDVATHFAYGGAEEATLVGSLNLPLGRQIYLTFDHLTLFESIGPYMYDGGVIEYSVDGGPWLDAKTLFNAGVNYNGAIYVNSYYNWNPLEGRPAFVGSTLNDAVHMRYNLTSLGGKNVKLRFRAGYDIDLNWGWFIDNVDVHTCVTAPAIPAVTSPAVNGLVIDYTPTLNWSDAVPDIDHYQVQVSLESDFDPLIYDENTGLVSEFTIPTDLNPNTKYYWRVKAFNMNNETKGWSTAFYFRTAVVPPALVSPSDTETLTYNRPLFDWDDVTGANGYTLQVSKNVGFTLIVLNVNTPTSATPASEFRTTADLPPGTLLYWRVRANAVNGPSDWSSLPVWTLTTANPPGVPTLVSPADNALSIDYMPLLDWSNSTLPAGVNFGYYEVQVADNAAFTNPTVAIDDTSHTLVTDSQHLVADGVLQPNLTYFWRVRAYNDALGFSNWSAVRKLRTSVLAPGLLLPPPSTVLNNNGRIGLNRISFDWDNVPGATGYTLQAARNDTFTLMVLNVNTTGPTASTYTTTADLPPAIVPLYWRVRANAANGPGAWSETWTLTTANPLGVPGLVSPADNGLALSNLPTLDWANSTMPTLPLPTPPGFSHYQLQVATDAAFTSNAIDESVGTLVTDSQRTLADALNWNSLYYWRVRAYNDAGDYSNWSAARRIRIAVPPPVLVWPTNASTLPLNRPPFEWSAVPGATGYSLQVSKNNTFTLLVLNVNTTGASASTYTPPTDLPPGTLLYWRARANAANGPSDWSTVRSLTTANPPSVPALVSPAENALTAGNYMPTLDWANSTLPAGPATFHHYQLQVNTNSSFTGTWVANDPVGSALTDSQQVIGPLDPNMTYYWRVQACNSYLQCSYFSAVRRLRTAVSMPALLLPADGLPTHFPRPVFAWNTVAGATGYTLQVSKNIAFTQLVINVNLTGATVWTYNPTADLPVAMPLWWRLRANALNGPGDWSPTWQITMSANPPSIPALTLPADNGLTTDYTPILDWSNSTLPTLPLPAPLFDHYQVQVATEPAFVASVIDTSVGSAVTDSQFAVPDLNALTPNALYYWRVRACNDATDCSTYSAARKLRTAVVPPVLSAPADASPAHIARPAFTWNTVSGATGYNLQVSKNVGFTLVVVNINTTGPGVVSYTPTIDLPGGIPLYWRVRANAVNGPGDWSTIWQISATANPPSVPVLVSPADNALDLSYTPLLDWANSTVPALPVPTTFDYYQVQMDTDTAFTDPWTINAPTTSGDVIASQYLVSGGLTTNTLYYWRVQACNTAGDCSNWSVVRKLRTAISAPGPLAPTYGETLYNNRPDFSWTDAVGATGFNLQVARNLEFTSVVLNVNTTGAQSYKAVADLPAATTLYWRVRGTGLNGPGNWSSPNLLNTANPPSVPSLVSPADNGLTLSYTPTLDWADVTLPTVPTPVTFDHYWVQVATDIAFTSLVMNDYSSLTTVTPSQITISPALLPNTLYYWRVAAYGNAGYSNWSAVRKLRTAVLPPVLAAPVNPTTLNFNRTVFDWGDVAGATGYNLQASKNPAFTMLVLNVNTVGALASTYTTTADLPAGAVLSWRVRANAVNGPGDWSPVWTINTANPPSVPALVTPADNGLTTDSMPTLDWANSTVPSGTYFDRYEVQVATDSAFTGLAASDNVSGVTNSQYMLSIELGRNTTYYWRVRSYNTVNDYSNWSIVRRLRIAVDAPLTVSPLDGASAGSLRPVFDWSDVSGATGYTIQISTTSTFTTLVVNVNITTATSTYTPTANLPLGTLYWRVRANAVNGPSVWSVEEFYTP